MKDKEGGCDDENTSRGLFSRLWMYYDIDYQATLRLVLMTRLCTGYVLVGIDDQAIYRLFKGWY